LAHHPPARSLHRFSGRSLELEDAGLATVSETGSVVTAAWDAGLDKGALGS
jgi:hypothetical protein